jgi:hypothetical protein
MTLDDLTPDELLDLVIEVIANGMPHDDAQVADLDHKREHAR